MAETRRELDLSKAMVRATWIGGGLALATVGILVFGMLGSVRHECEVCVTFRGHSACRTARGASADEARRTAKDNACALAGATGMTASIECQNAPEDRASCR